MVSTGWKRFFLFFVGILIVCPISVFAAETGLVVSVTVSGDSPNLCSVGDFNSDGKVNFWDFMSFIDAYGSVEGDSNWADGKGDFDFDGDVDFWDFMGFIDVYGMDCTSETIKLDQDKAADRLIKFFVKKT